MTRTIYLLNGPNLNLLGQRQPEIYGRATLADVEANCAAVCAAGFGVKLLQSNHEGQLIDWIHHARTDACGIVINPGRLHPHLRRHPRRAQRLRRPGDRGPRLERAQARVLPAPLLRLAPCRRGHRRARDRGLRGGDPAHLLVAGLGAVVVSAASTRTRRRRRRADRQAPRRGDPRLGGRHAGGDRRSGRGIAGFRGRARRAVVREPGAR